MFDAVKAGDLASYAAAAGLVAHYVGDASQPLHGSHVSDGIKGQIKGVSAVPDPSLVLEGTRVASIPGPLLGASSGHCFVMTAESRVK